MHLEKKTKIVATIGPATESVEMLTKLVHAGLNVVRLNFSHGDFKEHQGKVDNARKVVEQTGMPLAILQDLGGPKIRIGEFKTDTGRITLKKGQTFTITTREVEGNENIVSVNYPVLHKEVKAGEPILLDDGKKRLEVVEVKGQDVVCKVIVGGDTKGRRGLNLPGSDLSVSALTEKDLKDLEFGIKNKVDFIALSFVRRPSDIDDLRVILDKRKCKAAIIAKIETPQAVACIDEIISKVDGIMVARGDLAIEVPAEDVPLIQKELIQKCNEAGKPVITATQMLESMIHSPVPTRAEVSDIANAILDGTDAIMLSEETTLGEFPIEAVNVMSRVAKKTENAHLHKQLLSESDRIKAKTVGETVTASAVSTADRVGATCIVSLTNSGYSARMMSRHRSQTPILVFTPKPETYQKAVLYFGCWPVMIESGKDFVEAVKFIKAECKKRKLVKAGDRIVIASGTPFGKVVETNSIVVETI